MFICVCCDYKEMNPRYGQADLCNLCWLFQENWKAGTWQKEVPWCCKMSMLGRVPQRGTLRTLE